MTNITDLSLKDLRDKLAARELSAQEAATAHLDAIDAANGDLNAFTAITRDGALAQAKTSDERIAKGEAGLLEGVPVAVKDLFCTKGVRSTAASHILDGFTPEYESTVTSKLFAQGGVMLGKTNMDEFAMGSSNETSYDGACKNPWKRSNDDASLVPGGSSGGSASAVAANLAPLSLGSDTGGSIRQPASFCGIVGVKPTYGRCSRFGMIAFASSLDQAGTFARSVEDAAIGLQAIVGHDTNDSTSAPVDVPNFEDAFKDRNVKGLKVGIPAEYRVDGINDEIAKLWDQGAAWLKSQGAQIIPISLPHTKYALPTYYVLAPAEASSNLARYDGVRYGLRAHDEGDSLDDMYEKTRAAGFGDEVKRRIMIGTYVLSAGYYDAYYKKAQRVRTLVAQDFKSAFEQCDVILTPTTPSAAFGFGEKQDDPIQMYLNDMFTVPSSLAGLPGISVPAGLDAQGLPLGLQIIGRAFDEVSMFKAAAALEEAAAFHAKPQREAA